jgi:hypothetical protein
MQEHLEVVKRMTRDIKAAAKTLSDQEARYLVDYYYICQEDRKRANNQIRALDEGEEPNDVVKWLADQANVLERQIKSVLDSYTQAHMMGSWMREVYGIGPVLSAGLLAHLDIEKAPTVGHIWRFAGLDPTLEWKKGQKRPFNAGLKTLCWKIGQSFMKFHNQAECFYGHIYAERKEYEIARNERGELKEYALERAEKVGKSTEAYKHLSQGKIPPGQIDARARRYAVKLFLSHLHGEWYERHFGKEAPLPYPIAQLGHAHMIKRA